jgi:hypothetical protein
MLNFSNSSKNSAEDCNYPDSHLPCDILMKLTRKEVSGKAIHLSLLIILSLYQTFIELVKIVKSCPKVGRYFSQFFNFVSITSLALNFTVIICS